MVGALSPGKSWMRHCKVEITQKYNDAHLFLYWTSFVTVRQRSCGKVMFSQVCVCPKVGVPTWPLLMMYWTSLYSPPPPGHRTWDPLAPVPLLVTSGDHHCRPAQTCSLDLIVQVPMVLISGGYVWLASEWCTSSRNAFLLLPSKEVWGRVIFLHPSVILFMGEYLGRYSPRTRYTPRELCMLGDTGNKRAVRILRECILVVKYFYLSYKQKCNFAVCISNCSKLLFLPLLVKHTCTGEVPAHFLKFILFGS